MSFQGFQNLAKISADRKALAAERERQKLFGEVGEVSFDPGALDRRKADIEIAARAAFRVIQFLIAAGATLGHFCFMRRKRDSLDRCTGDRECTFPVCPQKKAEAERDGPLTFTRMLLAEVTEKKLHSWIIAGRTKRTSKTKGWAREAELHFRIADDIRDIFLVDDVKPEWLPRLRHLGLWHVTMETSAANFQVLLKLPERVGTAGRQAAQAAVATAIGGDLGSVAHDKWHRLPGSYNNKLGDAGRDGIDWLTRLPIADPSDGPPVADGAPAPSAWLATIPLSPPTSERPPPPAALVSDEHEAAIPIRSIKLSRHVRKIVNDSAREFGIAAELVKSGASLTAVIDHVVAMAERRGKYIKVKAGAYAYARRTLAGVMADFEFHRGATGRQLYDRHEAESRRIGCHPDDFDKARGAAAERAGRRRKGV